MRILFVSLFLIATARAAPPRATRQPPNGSAPSPEVRLEALQLRHHDRETTAAIRITNPTPRTLKGRLQVGPGKTASALLTLRPGEARVVEALFTGKAVPGLMERPLIAAFHFEGRHNPAQVRVETAIVDPVIPRSEESDAPTVDQFFANAPAAYLNRPDQWAGPAPWTPNSLSAKIQMQYDETGLSLLFDVTGSASYQTGAGDAILPEDSVQVAIDAADGRGKSGAPPPHSFGFALTPNGPQAIRTTGTGGWTGQVDARQAGRHTIYDIRIAWPDIAPLRPTPGTKFGMNFIVNGHDAKGRRAELQWTPGPVNNPALWTEWTLGQGS